MAPMQDVAGVQFDGEGEWVTSDCAKRKKGEKETTGEGEGGVGSGGREG